MTKKEAALILRAITMTTYKCEDEDEAWTLHQIKMKLMNIHPDQMEAERRGIHMTRIINRVLISCVVLLIIAFVMLACFA